MAAVKIQHRNCLQSTLWKKTINGGCTQDLWHSFSQYGPPGRQITYIILCWFLRRLYFLVPSRKLGYGLTYFSLEYKNFFSILFLLPCTCKVVRFVVTYRDGACLKISKCVNMVDRPTQLRNTWFGFLAFLIFLLLRVSGFMGSSLKI